MMALLPSLGQVTAHPLDICQSSLAEASICSYNSHSCHIIFQLQDRY